jgi:plastocyanin
MRRNAIAVLVFGVAALLLVPGCGSKKKSSASTTTTSTTAAPKTVGAPGAKVSVVNPKNGSTQGSTVPVKVKLSNFKLAPSQVGKAAKQGKGHLHFSIDDGKYDFPKYSGANGKLAVKLGVQGKYSPSVTPSITYRNLPAGKHKLEVYLANNDHTNTGVEANTSFTVKSGGTSSGSASGKGSRTASTGRGSGTASSGKGSGTASSGKGSSANVTVRDFSFTPKVIDVKAGSTVTWTNQGQTEHTVKGPGFFSPKALAHGDKYSFRFSRPGRFPYLCTLHPTLMRGTVVVTG